MLQDSPLPQRHRTGRMRRWLELPIASLARPLLGLRSLIGRMYFRTACPSGALPYGPSPDAPGLRPLLFRVVRSLEEAKGFAQRSEIEASSLYGGRGGRRLDPDNRHHSIVLVSGDVTVVDEVTSIRPAKIHPHGHRGKRMIRIAVPKWSLDRIKHLPLDARVGLTAVNFEIVLRLHQEMDLMDVELMMFKAPILNRPVLD